MIQCKTPFTHEVEDHLDDIFIPIRYWQPGGNFLTVEYNIDDGWYGSLLKGGDYDDSDLKELTEKEFLNETI